MEAKLLLFDKIIFIRKELIPQKELINAFELVKDIDPFDLDFIALTAYLKAKLWTGDKKLYNGLKANGFKSVINTPELQKLALDLH
jgi:predicted nucleic acid-binding protein